MKIWGFKMFLLLPSWKPQFASVNKVVSCQQFTQTHPLQFIVSWCSQKLGVRIWGKLSGKSACRTNKKTWAQCRAHMWKPSVPAHTCSTSTRRGRDRRTLQTLLANQYWVRELCLKNTRWKVEEEDSHSQPPQTLANATPGPKHTSMCTWEHTYAHLSLMSELWHQLNIQFKLVYFELRTEI